MTDVQFEILRTLYEAKNDFGDSIAKPKVGVINRVNLGVSALGRSDVDIEYDFIKLVKGLFLQINGSPLSSILDIEITDNCLVTININGAYTYENEKRNRELLRTKLEREVSLLESNIKVNGYQYWIKASIVTTAIATIFYVIISYLQLVETRLTKIVEKSELEQERPNDSLHYFQNGRDHHKISQTKP